MIHFISKTSHFRPGLRAPLCTLLTGYSTDPTLSEGGKMGRTYKQGRILFFWPKRAGFAGRQVTPELKH